MASRSDIQAGRAFVSLYVDNSALVRGLLQAKQRLQNFGKSIASLGTIVASTGAAITGSIIGAVTQFAGMGDDLNKMAARTGVATDALSELGFAAEQSGASLDAVEKGIKKMQTVIGGANAGSNSSVAALQGIGLAVADLMGLSPDQQMEKIAQGLSQIGDPGMRAAAAMRIFGEEGTALLPMFAGGVAGIRSLREEAKQLGLSITPEQAQVAADLTDAWNRAKRAVLGTAFAVGSQVAESVMQVLDVAKDVAGTFTGWIKEHAGITKSLLAIGAVLGVIGTAVVGIGGAFSAAGFVVGGLASTLSLAGTIIGAVFSPVGLIVAAVTTAVTGLLFAFYKLADPLTALMPLASAIATAFKGITGALLQGDFAGAFEAMASSIRSIMFAAARGVIDIVKNMLTNLIGLVTGTSDGIGGAMSGISSAASRIFNEVWEAGKIAFTALAAFAGDVFSQAPQVISYAFGLAIRKIVESVAALVTWMANAFGGFVSTLFKTFAGRGFGLLKAMLTGDMSGVADHFASTLRKSMAAQTLAMSGLAAGLFGGEMPEFKMSPETIAAYEKMESAITPKVESSGIEKVIDEYASAREKLEQALEKGDISAVDFNASMTELEATKSASIEKLIAAFTAEKAALDKLIADGAITPEAATERKSEIVTRQKELTVEVTRYRDSGQISQDDARQYQDELNTPDAVQSPKFDASSVNAFIDRVSALRQQLAAGEIDKQQFDAAFKTEQATLGVDVKPLDVESFDREVAALQKLLAAGKIDKRQFDDAFKSEQLKLFGFEVESKGLTEFNQRIADLREQLAAGKIDKQQFDAAFRDEQLKLEYKQAPLPQAPTAAPADKPAINESDLTKYKARVKELTEAFASGAITADELASGMSQLKREAVGIDATPLEQYDARLEILNQALADGTITQREWKAAVSDARDEIFGLAASPLEEFRERVITLQQAFSSGAISAQEYGVQLAAAKREILGIEPSNLQQFADRVKELREQFKAGAIDKAEFDSAFKTSQKNFLGLDTDPIDKFKEKMTELRQALDKGLITKDQFKTAAMDALPDRVKQIVDETRTPLEKYKADMAELDKLKGASLLDDKTYARKADKLREERDGNATASSKPTTFGSFSASALIDSGRGSASSSQDRVVKSLEKNEAVAKEQLAELKEQRKLIDKLASALAMR